MNAMTTQEAERDLEKLVRHVVNDSDPTIVIAGEDAKAVLISLEKYNSWLQAEARDSQAILIAQEHEIWTPLDDGNAAKILKEYLETQELDV